MEEKQLSTFLEKFSRNQHTGQEHEQFINWIKTLSVEEVNDIQNKYEEINKEGYSIASPILVAKIENRLDQFEEDGDQKVIPLWPKILKVAVACLVLVGTVLLFYQKTYLLNDKQQVAQHLIKQGGSKALLKLADGSEIILDSAKLGMLTSQNGTDVIKTEVGQVSFKTTGKQAQNPGTYNFISIPRGGQYIIELPDGSKIWLNSASSLKFPAVFDKNERLVELTGEAYFEVAKDKTRSFKVKTTTQSLEVLGTHFNINAYADEPAVATTLMEGSVKLSALGSGKVQMLKPGQQAKLTGAFKVNNVDTDIAIDWKNGDFRFSNENIEAIMRKVSRWYDVDVIYQGDLTNEGFVGKVPRSKNITEVLNALKLTGLINYKISGKQITITP